MLAVLHLLGTLVVGLFKSRRRLEVENLFLRHQLNIALRRKSLQKLTEQINDFIAARAPPLGVTTGAQGVSILATRKPTKLRRVSLVE